MYAETSLARRTFVTRQTIVANENGKYFPSLELAFCIADSFEIKLEDVFSYRFVEEKSKDEVDNNDHLDISA